MASLPTVDDVRDTLSDVRDTLPDEESFESRLHTQRTAALLGLALGVSFSVCFVTGLASHLVQNPTTWFHWPARPAGLYRISQGVHVTTGIASVPLLLAKLWTVYPQFWLRPTARNIAHAVERLCLLPLVGGAVFLLFTGVSNVAYWYDVMDFYFPAAHYWAAWVTIGALVVHIGAKLTTTRTALAPRRRSRFQLPGQGLDRRGFLLSVAAAAGVLVVATVGQTIGPLRRLSVLAPRRPDIGPQGLPVNKSASQAQIEEEMVDPSRYRLTVEGQVPTPLELSIDDLRAMPQREATLPIACVEGWSFSARWRGVSVRDLLDQAGAATTSEARVESLQRVGRYNDSPLNANQIADGDTLLALELNDEPLALDHGAPLRLIGPNRPGVQQTKWVTRIVVL